MSSTTGLRSFYSKKNIFLTGGSGFLGICLLEKILRTIPDHGEIYLLLRPKRGKLIEERLNEIKSNTVFNELLKEGNAEEVFGKIKAIAGDVSSPDLGLSAEDKVLLTSQVNIIFHSAATLDFGENLKDTVNINLLGTRRVADLAKDCRNLEALVHVSSAYANSFELEVEEKLYPLTYDPEKLIDLVNKVNLKALEEITPEILGVHPNTYTITKHMAEYEIKKMEKIVPCAIVRPSMILGSYKEPNPGWTMSKNGAQGFIMGASRGVVRRVPVIKGNIYDNIPVDFVVNNLLAAGYHACANKSAEVEVYHCTSSTRNPFRWIEVEDVVNETMGKYPLISAVWYPTLVLVPYLWLFKISTVFVHFVPAFFLDLLMRLGGKRPILWKLHKNVYNSLERLKTFIFTEWLFHAENTEKLHSWLSESDRRDFNLSLKELDWQDFCRSMVIGVRIYLNKEPLSNLKVARKKHSILKIIHYGSQVVGYLGILILTSWLFNASYTFSIFSSFLLFIISYLI